MHVFYIGDSFVQFCNTHKAEINQTVIMSEKGRVRGKVRGKVRGREGGKVRGREAGYIGHYGCIILNFWDSPFQEDKEVHGPRGSHNKLLLLHSLENPLHHIPCIKDWEQKRKVGCSS